MPYRTNEKKKLAALNYNKTLPLTVYTKTTVVQRLVFFRFIHNMQKSFWPLKNRQPFGED
jgi:hypothetical protein